MNPQKKRRRDTSRNPNGRKSARRMKRANQHQVRQQLRDPLVTLAEARSKTTY